MQDIEKSRATYVVQLEEQVERLQGEVARYKPLAEKWEPKVVGYIEPHDKQIRFTLTFGGKRVTAVMNMPGMVGNSASDITSSIASTLFENLVLEKIGDVLRPEVDRMKAASEAIMKAGQW